MVHCGALTIPVQYCTGHQRWVPGSVHFAGWVGQASLALGLKLLGSAHHGYNFLTSSSYSNPQLPLLRTRPETGKSVAYGFKQTKLLVLCKRHFLASFIANILFVSKSSRWNEISDSAVENKFWSDRLRRFDWQIQGLCDTWNKPSDLERPFLCKAKDSHLHKFTGTVQICSPSPSLPAPHFGQLSWAELPLTFLILIQTFCQPIPHCSKFSASALRSSSSNLVVLFADGEVFVCEVAWSLEFVANLTLHTSRVEVRLVHLNLHIFFIHIHRKEYYTLRRLYCSCNLSRSKPKLDHSLTVNSCWVLIGKAVAKQSFGKKWKEIGVLDQPIWAAPYFVTMPLAWVCNCVAKLHQVQLHKVMHLTAKCFTWMCISKVHIQVFNLDIALPVYTWFNMHMWLDVVNLEVHFQCAPGVLCAHCAPDYSICFSWMCIVKVRLVYEICFTWMCIVSLHLICVMCILCTWLNVHTV